MLAKVRDVKELRVPKNYGYSRLGPLNEYGRAVMLETLRYLDEKIHLYGLDKEVLNGITLRDLFFNLESSKADKIVKRVDQSPRAQKISFSKIRNYERAAEKLLREWGLY